MPQDLMIMGRPFPVQEGDTPEVIKDILVNKNGVSITPEMESAITSYFSQAAPEENFGSTMAGVAPKQKTMADFEPSDQLLSYETAKNKYPLGSTDRERADKAFNNLLNIEMQQQGIVDPSKIKTATPPGFTSAQQDDLNALKNILDIIPKYLELKNSGFNGEGVNTGRFADDIPADLSYIFNHYLAGQGAASSDRGSLRQMEKIFFNPVKKDISGTAVSDQERYQDLYPMLPLEGDEDQLFFKKGMQLSDAVIGKIHKIIETAEQSGTDMSKFSGLKNLTAAEFNKQLVQGLSKNKKGSFAREFPVSFIESMLGAPSQQTATPNAVSQQAPQMSEEEKQAAMEWLQTQSPTDPKAIEVRKRLGAM